MCYVSDHWAEYVGAAGADGSSSHSLSLDKLQLEFDHLFLRAVLHVLKNKRSNTHLTLIILPCTSWDKTFLFSCRLGIWLFMSEMPYGTLSSSMLWKVLYVMQCAETAGLETISTTCDTRSCVQALRGKSRLLGLIALYLFSTMKHDIPPLTQMLQLYFFAFTAIIITAHVHFQSQSTRRGLRHGCVK